jgi:hypothetical protein
LCFQNRTAGRWQSSPSCISATGSFIAKRLKEALVNYCGGPWGTGPYKLVVLHPQKRSDRVVLEANTNWDPTRFPRLQHII